MVKLEAGSSMMLMRGENASVIAGTKSGRHFLSLLNISSETKTVRSQEAIWFNMIRQLIMEIASHTQELLDWYRKLED